MNAPEPTPRQIWPFPGGLHLDEHKAESTGTPIQVAPIPPLLIHPLQQHIGAPAKARVVVGEKVLRGQPIAEADGYVSAPVHAGSSGTVVAIEERPVPHPSGLSAMCIVIETDGEDTPLPQPEWPPQADYTELEPQELRQRVRRAGIAGLGGAAFPSFIKLNPGRPVSTLILNGAECEPYISCDQMLMAERAEEIVAGAGVILHAIKAPKCLIGVEDNKPESIRALREAAQAEPRIEVVVVPTKYPQGGEKQLIMALTGKEVPSLGLPLDIGIVCHNVGTAAAVWRAVTQSQPLISRVVTVTGGGVAQPQNFEVRLGTPAQFLIELAGGERDAARLIMGGPMMGFALRSAEVPVIKATNCLLLPTAEDVKPEAAAMPCIRCGACVDVCPAQLLPQQLYWHSRAREFDKAQEYALFDCIECGCCAQVCPSQIPLVQYYRFAKTEIWAEEREKRKADAARERHEARKLRLEREEAEREAARQRKKAALAAAKQERGAKDPVADAVAAGKQRKAQINQSATGDDPVAAAMAAAKARKAAKAAAEAQSPTASEPTAADENDPVAKAMAAAKARRAAKAAAESGEAAASADSEKPAATDPVAAAIAAAKARKQSKADTAGADDAVAKAVAAAKARKAAKAAKTEEPTTNDGSDDPVARAVAAAKVRKAAKATQDGGGDDPVAKAIAAAKARKAAKAAPAEPPSAPADDPVAQAIAAAKARKAEKAAADAAPQAKSEPAAADDPVARAIAAARARKAAKQESGDA